MIAIAPVDFLVWALVIMLMVTIFCGAVLVVVFTWRTIFEKNNTQHRSATDPADGPERFD